MKITYIIAVLTMLSPLFGNAQDGEQLFKAKCNTCHILGKDGTGPNLKGAKAKWDDAGETDLLYQWVANSGELIASGKSQMALAIKDFSPTTMSPQIATPEEIDAILAYVDAWEPAPETPKADANGVVAEGPVTYVPNYKKNLTLFWALLASIGAILVGIIIMSGSIIRLIHSDYFREKASKGSNNPLIKTVVLLIGFTALMGNSSYALTFNGPGEAAEGMPWLLVEDMDIYVMILINLILLGVLFYVRRLFRIFMAMTKTEKELEVQKEQEDVIKKVNQILTDVVPIEEEHKILMHHEYDGIKELDNNLPPWWLWGFYISIAFAFIYLFNYHIFKTSDLQVEAYNKSMAQAEKDIEAYRKANAMNIDETNVTLLTEDADLSKGKAIFKAKCAVCHGDNGEGNIGPNLSDKSWLYGYNISDVFQSINEGRPNGMQAWNAQLNPVQIQQVASYVLSIPEATGKSAEGTFIEE